MLIFFKCFFNVSFNVVLIVFYFYVLYEFYFSVQNFGPLRCF